jgi:hypothetical protein
MLSEYFVQVHEMMFGPDPPVPGEVWAEGGGGHFEDDKGIGGRYRVGMMKRAISGTMTGLLGAGGLLAADFEAPVMLMGGDEPVRVDSPGYAAPCWADVTGDGHKDLLVGQFSGGKIRVYAGDAEGKLGKGEFLKAGSEVASVPGVW